MDSPRPLVSVGITTFNRPKGLRRTLECITGQTYTNLEILIGDNQSGRTETKKIVTDLQKSDFRIKYFQHQTNIGSIFNGLFVLKQASGEYFMFASDDDEWYPEYIEKCINPIIHDKSIVCSTSRVIIVSDVLLTNKTNFCRTDSFTGKDNVRSPYWLCSGDFHTHGLAPIKRIKKIILNTGMFVPIYGIYRTKFLREKYFDISFNPHKFGSDRYFLARLSLYGSIHQVSEPLFVYHHGFGASSGNSLSLNNAMSKWQYYGLRINPLLTAYINMIIDSLSWPVSITDHIRVVGYYLARMAKAKYMRYTMKTPFFGTPLYDYKPPEYPKRE